MGIKKLWDFIYEIMKKNEMTMGILGILKIVPLVLMGIIAVRQNDDILFVILHKFSKPLNMYSTVMFWVRIICNLLIYEWVERALWKMNEKYKNRIIPFWKTSKEAFEIFVWGFSNTKIVYDLELCFRGQLEFNTCNSMLYFSYLIWLAGKIFIWEYVKNKEVYFHTHEQFTVKYTEYVDCKGPRILEDDKVVYYGRIYRLQCKEKMEQNGLCEKDWYLARLSRKIDFSGISLEKAARDEKGNLRVYDYRKDKDHINSYVEN